MQQQASIALERLVIDLEHGAPASVSILPAPTGSDEARNAGGDGKLFYSRPLSENPAAPGGAFDDRITWLSPNLVAHRLVSAGRLP